MPQKQANDCSTKILECFSNEGDEFLSNIVTEDETWVTYAKRETKRQSRSDINPVYQWSQKVLTNNLYPQIDGHIF